MYWIKKNQIKSVEKKYNELELTPHVNKSRKLVRKICRIPTSVTEQADSGQTEEHGEGTSTKPNSSTTNVKELEESHPRFGPIYGVDQTSVKATKAKAWEHVLKKSLLKMKKKANGSTDQEKLLPWRRRIFTRLKLLARVVESTDASKNPLLSEISTLFGNVDQPSDGEDDKEFIKVIEEIYSTAVRKAEKEAMEIYADHKLLSSYKGSDFRWMMIKDGCFFLQLAFWILGCFDQLGYPAMDPIFGKNISNQDVNKWIEAMFYVGNQIPLVVLKQLMNQTFFQDLIKEANWDSSQYSSMSQKVLYQVLVLPAIKGDQRLSLTQRIGGIFKGRDIDPVQSCDMFDCLHNLLLGAHPYGHVSTEYKSADDDIDLEANEDEVDDFEWISPITDDNSNGEGGRTRTNDRRRIFPCATELQRAGIYVKKLKSGGARSICFKSYWLWPRAYLYLPVFVVEHDTEMILGKLTTYESLQQSGRKGGEVRSYLRVMSDIVETVRDAKLLEKRGVVEGGSDDNVEKLPRILRRLSSGDSRLTHDVHSLRRRIRDYSSPWIHYKGVINFVVFLTVLQTVFTLLAYFKPP